LHIINKHDHNEIVIDSSYLHNASESCCSDARRRPIGNPFGVGINVGTGTSSASGDVVAAAEPADGLAFLAGGSIRS
jgi:hypothetical protein